MEVRFYIKVKNNYELRELIPEKNSNRKFFEQLKININEQLENIKIDIIKYIGNSNSNIAYPKHDDYVIQKKLDKLNELRKQNLIAKLQIQSILRENDFIFCECGSKMYSTPVGVPFRKINNGYILLQEPKDAKYLYRCENCWRCLSPEHIEQENNNLKLRKKLEDEGYNFLPNKFGLWHYNNNGKPLRKPDYMK